MAINQFFLDKKDVVLIKPLKPTPSHVLSLSTIDNDPNLELLCQTIYVYQASPASSNGNVHEHHLKSNSNGHTDPDPNPASVIKEALSKVLVYYYPLAGKLKRHSDGKFKLNCNEDGVPFLEATATCSLESLNYFDGIDVETAKKFVFDFPCESSDDDHGSAHPLVLQVTKFLCGGFTIGMGLWHTVCDGVGAAQLFRAMAELASGKSEVSVKPVWEREKLVGKRLEGPPEFLVDMDSVATSPYLPTTDVVHEAFLINSDTIRKLKMSMIKEIEDANHETSNNQQSFTTIEVLGAYIWRSRLRALELNPDGKTLFCLTMGIRHRLNPPLPDGFYGNAFGPANLVLTGRELNECPLSSVVKLIKESKKIASRKDHIQKSIDMLETIRELNVKVEGCGGNMVLTDWRQLGFEVVDFGWKEAVNVIPIPWNMFGYVDLCIFLSPSKLEPSMKGGVRVLVSLPRAAMPKFKEEMEALKTLAAVPSKV